LARQIPGELFNKLLTVFGTVLPALFESDDASPNFPVCSGHDRIYISGSGCPHHLRRPF
jgi:hypothetical protein